MSLIMQDNETIGSLGHDPVMGQWWWILIWNVSDKFRNGNIVYLAVSKSTSERPRLRKSKISMISRL